MGDMAEGFKALKQLRKDERAKRVLETSDLGWSKHSAWHWHKDVNGSKLDFWPSTGKFKYKGRYMGGNVKEFINARSKDKLDELTKNQVDIYDHTKRNGFFGTDKNSSDFKDCEILFEKGLFKKAVAADWMIDDFVYHVKRRINK